MPLEAVPTLYTSQAEMESLFGFLGVQLRLDDDDDEIVATPETEYLTDVMVEATDIINQHIGWIYDDVELSESRWVRRRASWIACHLISKRRGNAKQFQEQFDQCMEDFREVELHRRWIPRKKPKYDFAPAMSNLRIDYRYSGYRGYAYGASPQRVDPISSTRGGGDSAFKDWAFWGWL